VLRAKRWLPSLPGLAGIVATGIVWWPAIFGIWFIRYRNGNERGNLQGQSTSAYARAAAPIIGSIYLAERTNSFETPAVAQSLLRPDSHRPLTLSAGALPEIAMVGLLLAPRRGLQNFALANASSPPAASQSIFRRSGNRFAAENATTKG
jgi:hypothetical protein